MERVLWLVALDPDIEEEHFNDGEMDASSQETWSGKGNIEQSNDMQNATNWAKQRNGVREGNMPTKGHIVACSLCS